jgi:hypothetical protein
MMTPNISCRHAEYCRWTASGAFPVIGGYDESPRPALRVIAHLHGRRAEQEPSRSGVGLARRSGPFRHLHLAPPSKLNKQQNRTCGSGYRAFFLLAIVRLNR